MHRDIKPANVLIMGNGQLKVADLGLGRFFSDQTMEAFSKVGTPVYMSPEALHGKGYDFKSDVWSLGCLLYELATLRTPFKNQGDNLYAIFKRINDCKYEPLPDRCSPEMRHLVNSILVTDPSKRPELADLNNIAMHEAQKAAAKVRGGSGGGGGGGSGDSGPDATGAAGRVMEWLKIMNWEEEWLRPRRLATPSRHFFALDQAGGVAGHDRFSTFAGVVSWLLERCGAGPETPLTGVSEAEAATTIINELKKLSLRCDYKLPVLKRGFGCDVCQVLEELCVVSATRGQWAWKTLVRPDESAMDELPDGDEGEMAGDAGEGEAVEEEEEPEMMDVEEDHSRAHLDVIYSSISPEDWAKEATRATEALKKKMVEGRKGWQEHIGAMGNMRKVIMAEVGTSSEGLSSLFHQISEDLESMRTKEQAVQERYQDRIMAYEREKGKEAEVKQAYATQSSEVEVLADQLNELSEALDKAKDDMQEHSSSKEDSSPVVKLKQAVKKMKEETTVLSLRIGVAKQLLAQKQLAARREGTSLSPKKAADLDIDD